MSVRRMLAVASLLAIATGSAQAAVEEILPNEALPAVAGGAMIDETPRLWFVEFAGLPVSEGGSEATIDGEHSRFRSAARAAGASFSERQAFKTLFNGFSVAASPAQIARLRGVAGVKAVYPVVAVARPDVVAGPSPEMFTALSMSGADVAQNELGLNGKGIKVAVMDTGIDYDNADLGGDGVPRPNSTRFPNSRVVGGWDFVGDAFNADPDSAGFDLTLTPDAYPDDCGGHGSHVAGIIGASGFVTGVAPKAKLYSYRVFGCEGSTTAEVMIAAMERALKDKVDVLNMSIGSAFTWPQYPTAVAANRLVKKGVVVVASIGNSGTSGLYAAGSPGLGKDVIGVASFDNVKTYLNLFRISPDAAAVGWGPATGAPLPPTSGTFPVAVTTPATGCDPLPAGSLAGKVALIRRGTCTFYAKAANAQAAGAVAVVLYNNASGRVSPTVAGSPAITIPVVAVTLAEGTEMAARIAGGGLDLTWTDEMGSFLQATGNLISSFSSYGLSPDLDVKPDIGAPGGSIYSTYPLELGGHVSMSGTSMASPHVAGSVALLLQARHMDAKEVRAVLQNTALPKNWSLNPGLGLLDGVARQGAGMIQIDDAVTSQVTVEPGKLALGESQGGPVKRELEIENHGKKAVTYDLSFENTVTVAGTYTQSFFGSDATVAFSKNPVTVPGHGEAEIKVTITAPTGPDKGIYGGYIVLTPQGGGQVLRVPFAGFVGDYQSIQVLTPTAYGFPWLAILYGGEFYGPVAGPADWWYSMAGEDFPYFLVHLDHPSRLMFVDIFDASGKNVGQTLQDEYLPRNSTATGFFALMWDGTVTKGKKTITVPNGLYTARISILKALGHPFNPAHWETWTSPVIEIRR